MGGISAGRARAFRACVGIALLGSLAHGAAAEDPLPRGQRPGPDTYVAGLEPDRRPSALPVLTAFPRDAQRRARALSGIPDPLPRGLGFLDSQGAWYSPFLLPGMARPYDIRSMHRAGGSR